MRHVNVLVEADVEAGLGVGADALGLRVGLGGQQRRLPAGLGGARSASARALASIIPCSALVRASTSAASLIRSVASTRIAGEPTNGTSGDRDGSRPQSTRYPHRLLGRDYSS
jgi:hypothetical protein